LPINSLHLIFNCRSFTYPPLLRIDSFFKNTIPTLAGGLAHEIELQVTDCIVSALTKWQNAPVLSSSWMSEKCSLSIAFNTVVAKFLIDE